MFIQGLGRTFRIMDDDGESIINPSSDEVLLLNQTIILIGEVDNMDKFKEQL